MAKKENKGIFKVVNHREYLIGEKIADFYSKLTSGSGAGSQEIDYCLFAAFARRTMQCDANRQIILDDKTISEVQYLILKDINLFECDEYKTYNQKIHLRNAIAFLVLDKAKAIVKSTDRRVSYRWFVNTFKKGHRDTLTKFIEIVTTQQWSESAIAQMNSLQYEIINAIF